MKALVKKSPEVGIWMEDVPVPNCGTNDEVSISHKMDSNSIYNNISDFIS